jgi:hypothetical protein
MPPLDNIKWERFCQNIVNGVAKRGQKNTQGQRYIEAGFNAKDVGKDGGSAEACASRLLKRAKVEERIAELLAEAQTKATTKRAYTINEITDRMALASRMAEEIKNPSAITQAEKAIAEVRGLIVKHVTHTNGIDYNTAQSMQEIGCKLLQSVGFTAPDDARIKLAIEANDVFVARLEEITRQGQALMIEQDDA